MLQDLTEPIYQQGSSSSSDVPEEWAFILESINQAHLPYLGMPLSFEKSASSEQQKAYNPKTGELIDLSSGAITKPKTNPVGFIRSSSSRQASARLQRLSDSHLQDSKIISALTGNTLLPCICHGDYVLIDALQADHVQPKSDILKRQAELIEKMNAEPEFAEFLLKQPGMEKFFAKHNDKYYGTLFFYKVYFNDVDNIWLICQACNQRKSDEDVIAWFKEQWLFGQEFLDYLGSVRNDEILKRTQNKQGLAEVAIEWFWNRHTNYISLAKDFFIKIKEPIEILSRKIDWVKGTGNLERMERLQASAQAKILLLEAVVNAPIGMPKAASDPYESSSDSGQRLSDISSVDVEDYAESTKVAAKGLPTYLRETMKQQLEMNKERKREIEAAEDDRHIKIEPEKKIPYNLRTRR